MNLSLTQIRLGSGLTALEIDVSGVAGAADAPLLKKTLGSALQQGYRAIVVNLTTVRDMDPACWEKVVSASRRMARVKGYFVLLRCPDSQYDLLVTRRWERCFLLPVRRQEDLEALPAELRAWVEAQAPVPAAVTGGEPEDAQEDGPHGGAAAGSAHVVTIPADDDPVRRSFLRHIGRKFGRPARRVLEAFIAHAGQRGSDRRVDVLVSEDHLVALDHGGRTAAPADGGGVRRTALTAIVALGGVIRPWKHGLRMDYGVATSGRAGRGARAGGSK